MSMNETSLPLGANRLHPWRGKDRADLRIFVQVPREPAPIARRGRVETLHLKAGRPSVGSRHALPAPGATKHAHW